MASTLNEIVKVKRLGYYFTEHSICNGVQHANNHKKQPKCSRYESFQVLKRG